MLDGRTNLNRRPTVERLEPRRLLAVLPAGFTETRVSLPVTFGTAIEIAPDGKLFVLEQAGTMQVYSRHIGPISRLQPNFFRDAPLALNSADERGLLGIAFDPNYAINRFVYIYYTASSPAIHNRVSRFTANAAGDLALAGSEVTILDIEDATATNHNGGAMHFGPDGKLYVAVGDHASHPNAQSITTLKGKILRLNPVPGDIVPADNPTSIAGIAGTTSGLHRTIWAAGLRNPYTFAFQPGTGRMFINDVGELTWEEINEGGAGRNYGWRLTEGDFDPVQFPDFTRPFHAYDHTVGQAITGGAFYDPSTATFPAEYASDYFFADFATSFIRRIDLTTKTVSGFATLAQNPVDLRVAPDGSLLYIGYGSTNRFVMRVQYIQNQPPAVDGSVFDFDGVILPQAPHRLRFAFSEDVSASLSNADLTVLNTTTGQPVATGSIAVAWDAPTKTGTFTFPGFSNSILPDGRYTATLQAAGITDVDGNPLTANHVFTFFVLGGDANRDAQVNLLDFNILASNFGQSPRGFAKGDFSYDGQVNLTDFNILASRFGVAVGPSIVSRADDSHANAADDPLEEILV